MATSSFTKEFFIEENATRNFVETLTNRGVKKERKKFDSKFRHIKDCEMILNILSKNDD